MRWGPACRTSDCVKTALLVVMYRTTGSNYVLQEPYVTGATTGIKTRCRLKSNGRLWLVVLLMWASHVGGGPLLMTVEQIFWP